jgi:hypothetical protein
VDLLLDDYGDEDAARAQRLRIAAFHQDWRPRD